jgi:hypothetical protein
MRGSVLVTFDELVNDRGIDNYQLEIGPGTNQLRDVHFTDCTNLYSTYMFVGNIVTFSVIHSLDTDADITIKRFDYTTDDENGDNGIKEVNITPVIQTFVFSEKITIATFTGSTVPSAYNFKYVIDARTRIAGPTPTPTTTPSPTLTPTPTPTPTPVNEGRYLMTETDNFFQSSFGAIPVITKVVRNSSDRGVTFTTISGITSPSENGEIYSPNMFISSGGTFQYFTDNSIANISLNKGGYLFRSTNTGTSFSPVTNFVSGDTRSTNWTSIDGSQNGKYLALTKSYDGYSPLFYSTDSGSTFTFVSNSVNEWKKVVVPNNNLLPIYANIPNKLYRLDSLSGPFIELTGLTSSLVPYPMDDFAVSENGQVIYVTQTYNVSGSTIYGGLFKSTNSGNTFTKILSPDNPVINFQWIGPVISMSADGADIIIESKSSVGTSKVIYSIDSGTTWNNYTDGALIPYEQYFSVSDSGQYVYKSKILNSSLNRSDFYGCNNFLSGCTLLQSYTQTSSSPGFLYKNVTQNKEQFGVIANNPPTLPVGTPTYGPYSAKIDVTFNYSGITSGDVLVDSLVAYLDKISSDPVQYAGIDSLNIATFTGTTGTVKMYPSIFVNDPNQVGTFLRNNTYLLVSLVDNSPTKSLQSFTQRVYKNNTLIRTATGTTTFLAGTRRFFENTNTTISQGDNFLFEFDFVFA